MRKYKYNWNIMEGYLSEPDLMRDISKELEITDVTAQLLMNRNCRTPEQAKAFLSKSEVMLHDPFDMLGMDEAVVRILDAIENEEKIIVYGDYDVDGVTSVCTLLTYLRSISAKADYYIPNRAGEGYGISTDIVRSFAADGVSVIITVDTGITAFEEAELCRELGITLIVTDHHECHTSLPDAYTIVNPRQPDCPYPFKELAGVGVVFKVICAIEKVRSEEDLYTAVKRICKNYIDLVAIGTIADVMPLKDENRLIVAEGLRKIENTDRAALIALIDAVSEESKKTASQKKITSGYISYSIAPRINAAGRISSAALAVELFLCEDQDKAAVLARKLCEINRDRQHEENEIAKSANEKISCGAMLDGNGNESCAIVLEDETWHHGIIGIVASRLTEKYGKPSILISFEGSGNSETGPEDVGKGSGRSVKGINLVDALHACEDLLEKYGGHELAAGLSIKRKNLPEFRRRLSEYVRNTSGEEAMCPGFEYDMELKPQNVTMRQASELYLLEPFGVSNPQPLFVIKNLPVVDYCTVGAGKHTKFNVQCGKNNVTVMCFRHIPADFDVYPGDKIDILFNLDINEFQGHKNLQFIAKDVRLCEKQYNDELMWHEEYDSLLPELLKGQVPENAVPEEIIPSRDDVGAIYNLLKSELRLEHEVFSIRALRHLIGESGGGIPYAKLRFIIHILNELGLIKAEETDTELEQFEFTYIHVKERKNLEDSILYSTLQKCRN